MERAFDFNFVNVNLWQFSVLDGVEASFHDPFTLSLWKQVRVLLLDPRPQSTSIHQAIAKRKPWSESGVQPDPDCVPPGFVSQFNFCQQRFDGLRLVQRSHQAVSGDDSQTQRLIWISTQKLRVVGIQSVQGFGFDSQLIIPVKGNAFRERMNRSVCTFVFIGTDDVVQRHVLKPVRFTMNLVDLRLLSKAVFEDPFLHLWLFQRKHGFVNDLLGRFQISSQQVSGRHEGFADVVQVFCCLVARKCLRGIKHRHVQVQQVPYSVPVLA